MNNIFKIGIGLILVVLSLTVREYPKYLDYTDDNLHVYFLDVNGGDSILIKTPDQKYMLIDGGPGGIALYRLSDIIPFWIKHIDTVIITHAHTDHTSGLVGVIDTYQIGCVVYDMSREPLSNTESELRESLQKVGFVSSTSFYTFTNPYASCELNENIELNLIYVPRDSSGELIFAGKTTKEIRENTNNTSIIVHLKYGQVDFLLMADAEIAVQKEMFGKIPTGVEILKVPHQGSRDSLYLPLLRKTTPALAVIFVDKNTFGHPNIEVLEAYEKEGIPILRTDNDETIHIRTDGTIWEVLQ